jgi:hypothetical protein
MFVTLLMTGWTQAISCLQLEIRGKPGGESS